MTLKWIMKHGVVILISSVLYLISFHISFINFTGIYFYDGIIRLMIVMGITLALEIYIRKKIKFDYKDICLSICAFTMINMVWLSLCIVSLDRSLSVFLLCYMNEYEQGLDEEQIEDAFQEIFVYKYGMLDRRFDEQLKSGNIEYVGDKYILTNRGKQMVSIFKTVGNLYDVDNRFIEPNLE